MKRLLLALVILFTIGTSTSYALEMLVKVGSQYLSPSDPLHGHGWRDGSIVDIRPSGFHNRGTRNCIVDFPNIDYWTLRGSTDWKSTKASVMNLKKFISRADATGKHRWQAGYDRDSRLNSKRDYYFDFQDLLDNGDITQVQYDSIYDSGKPHLPISFPDLTIITKLKRERINTRKNEK